MKFKTGLKSSNTVRPAREAEKDLAQTETARS